MIATPGGGSRYTAIGLISDDRAREYDATTTADGTPIVTTPEDVRHYLAADVTPDRAVAYIEAGMRHAPNIVVLHRFGCPPDVVSDWLAAQSTPSGRDYATFVQWYESSVHYVREHGQPGADYAPILNALMRTGALPDTDDLIAWQATGIPAHRIPLLDAAGITPTEANTSEIAAAPEDTLRAMAALRATGSFQ